jgi:hypothetical protein
MDGPQSESEHFGEEKNLDFLPEFNPQIIQAGE